MESSLFRFIAPTDRGMAMVILTPQMAQELRDVIDEWLSTPQIIDLTLCEACNVYVAIVKNHGCQGVH